MKRILALLIAVMMIAALTVSVSAAEPAFEPVTSAEDFDLTGETKYYFTGVVEGTRYFATGATLLRIDDPDTPWPEEGNFYAIATSTDFTDGNILYMSVLKDENGYRTQYDLVAGGVTYDCGLWLYESGANRNDGGPNFPQSYFQWDEENDILYREVLGVERTFALGWCGNGWGVVSVSKAAYIAGEQYNGKPMYPVQLAVQHVCVPGEAWESDEDAHWHMCECGEKTDYAFHDAQEWTTTKEPAVGVEGEKTGTCVCGYKVTEKIPALKDETKEDPTEEQKDPTESTKKPTTDNKDDGAQTPAEPAPLSTTAIVLIVLIVVVGCAGIVFVILGLRKPKKAE